MNIKYHIDSERKTTVLTSKNEIIDRGIYTTSTEEILSLENYAESTKNKTHIFEKRLNEITNKIRTRNKYLKRIHIITFLLSFILLLLSSIIINITPLLIAMIIILIETTTIVIDKALTKKDNEIKKYCSEKITEGKIKLNKINKKIEILSKDHTQDEAKKINTFIDIAPLERYEMDAEDQFISQYQIDKRTREMTKSTSKTKKLSKSQIENSLYQI